LSLVSTRLQKFALHFSQAEWPYLESVAESSRRDSRSTLGLLKSDTEGYRGSEACYTPTEKGILAAYEGV